MLSIFRLIESLSVRKRTNRESLWRPCPVKCYSLIAAVAWFALASPSRVVAQDRVFPKEGAPASGTIESLSPASVTISSRGRDQEFALSDVRKITFDGEPNGLDRGRELVLQEQYAQALDELKRLSPEEASTPRVKEDIKFYRWYSEGKLGLAGQGDKSDAVRGLLQVAQNNRQTHHLYPLSELLGQLALALDQPDQATKYFRMLTNAPDKNTQLSGQYRLGQVELIRGEVDAARSAFEAVTSASTNSAEIARIKSLAEVGLARCMSASGQPQQALEKLNAMVQKHDSTDQELFAKINNARGACHRQQDRIDQALLSYLQTDLLFFTDAEAHAEALYHLTQLWPKVGEPARAAEARSRLVDNYASSRWANQ